MHASVNCGGGAAEARRSGAFLTHVAASALLGSICIMGEQITTNSKLYKMQISHFTSYRIHAGDPRLVLFFRLVRTSIMAK